MTEHWQPEGRAPRRRRRQLGAGSIDFAVKVGLGCSGPAAADNAAVQCSVCSVRECSCMWRRYPPRGHGVTVCVHSDIAPRASRQQTCSRMHPLCSRSSIVTT